MVDKYRSHASKECWKKNEASSKHVYIFVVGIMRVTLQLISSSLGIYIQVNNALIMEVMTCKTEICFNEDFKKNSFNSHCSFFLGVSWFPRDDRNKFLQR